MLSSIGPVLQFPVVNESDEEYDNVDINVDIRQQHSYYPREAGRNGFRAENGCGDTFKFDFEEDDIFEDLLPMLKKQRLLDREALIKLIDLTKRSLIEMSNVIYVNFTGEEVLHVFGDTHGQFYDVASNLLELGAPTNINQYLFNGDFVDRGNFSVELCITLFALAIRYPKYFYLLKGNHECRVMTSNFGFKREVKEKYDLRVYEAFLDCFRYLPLAAIVNKRTFICHGGLFKEDGVSIQDIQEVDRSVKEGDGDYDNSFIVNGLLWSDPVVFWEGRKPSIRGCQDAVEFGESVTNEFLKTNNLDLVIRSHQMVEAGYDVTHGERLITVFSAPNYCKQGNKGAFLDLDPKGKYKFVQFEKAPAPAAKWMMKFSSCMPS